MKIVLQSIYSKFRYNKAFFAKLILFCTGALLFSCSLFTEPEPFVNEDMKLTEMKSYMLTNYSTDQVLAGIISLPFIPDSNVSEIDHVSLFIDSIAAVTITNSPFIFSVDTRNWPNGKHTISFCVYEKENSMGLLDLISSPSQIYTLPVVFDNTPPISPTNIVITNQDNHSYISWTPTDMSNFYSYVIRRNGVIIANLYNQSDSLFIDSSYILSDYFRVSYSIGGSTTGSIKYSQEHVLSQGESLMLESVSSAVAGLSDQVIFQSQSLISISTHTCNELAQYNINQCLTMTANLKGTSLIYFKDNNIYTFDINTLQLKGRQQLYLNLITNPLYAASGPDSCMFLSITNGDLFIYYYGSYGLRDKEFEPPATFLSISPDEKILFAGDKQNIKKYSLTISRGIPPPSLNLISQSSEVDPIDLFKVDWNKSKLFVKRGNIIVEEWDTETFSRIKSFNLSNTIHEVSEITATYTNSKNLYVAYSTQLNNTDAAVLAEYDIVSGQQSRSWTFSYKIQSLLGSENGRYLFACSSTDQWIVDTGDSN
ncbi:MAG: hypothetical protein ACM34N_02485 [Ignavibacteria bacterium]